MSSGAPQVCGGLVVGNTPIVNQLPYTYIDIINQHGTVRIYGYVAWQYKLLLSSLYGMYICNCFIVHALPIPSTLACVTYFLRGGGLWSPDKDL